MSAIVVLGEAETVELTGLGLIGRAPNAEPGEFLDRMIRIDDPTRSVSKSHLAFGVDADGLWIQDRWSANGTVLVRDSLESRCEAGRRIRLAAGDVVKFGGTTLRVVAVD